MIVAADPAAELFEPGLYHDPGRSGFFSILQKHDGSKRQESYPLRQLADVLRYLPRDRDSWLSQAEFFRPNRRLVNLARVGLQFADLDTYRSRYAGLSPAAACGAVLDHLDAANKPLPSVMIYSGRGLAAKWLLDGTVPRAALPRWNAAQSYVNAALVDFGADVKAKDASRVLRVERTVNTKSGDVVRVLWTNERNGEIVRYGFDDLCHEFLPLTREELAEKRAERQRRRLEAEARRGALRLILGARHCLRRFSERQLWWDRVEDLRTLARLRGWHHGNPPGRRDVFLFVAVCGLAWAVEPPLIHAEMAALAREFCPTWSRAEVHGNTSAAIRRAVAHANGETVEFRGTRIDPRYRFTNGRLMELLEITGGEERQLKTIITRDEKRRRDREATVAARRAVGIVPRAEYEGRARERQQRAHMLRALGHGIREIAAALGTSERHVRRIVAAPPPG